MATITHYDVGDIWPIRATYTVGGVATDPTTVTVKVKDPDGNIDTIGPVSGATGGSGIVRTAAGTYTYNVILDDTGYWFAWTESTGAVVATEQHQAIVDPSEFYESAQLGTRALVSLAETKDWLERQNLDTSNDLDLARVINDISDRFHEEAEREFKVVGTNPQTRLFEVGTLGRRQPYYVDGDYLGDRNAQRRRIKVGDLTSFTAISILDTDWTTVLESPSLTKVVGRPLNRKPWEPITELEFRYDVTSLGAGLRVSVTGNFGFPAVPGTVRQAVLDAIAANMDRDVEHYRQDLGVVDQQEGTTTVLVGGGRQRLLSMPPASLAVAWSFRDQNVG